MFIFVSDKFRPEPFVLVKRKLSRLSLAENSRLTYIKKALCSKYLMYKSAIERIFEVMLQKAMVRPANVTQAHL